MAGWLEELAAKGQAQTGVEEAVQLRQLLADKAAAERLRKLGEASPLYRNLLLREPQWVLFLESPEQRDRQMGPRALARLYETEFARDPASRAQWLGGLQRFRRVCSLRLAYREVNALAPWTVTVRELSDLADFCVQTVLGVLRAQWEEKLGTPWDRENDRPCPFTVLALGKLGARELNFCSDIDLIYVYETPGQVRRKDGRLRDLTNTQFFARLCQDLTATLQERGEHGFLFNVDLRLRPEGENGPVAHSLPALEQYYTTAGQTWERMAMIRARAIAGDPDLAGELFETLHFFRYPRHLSQTVRTEIAGVKIRTEKEVVGHAGLEKNIKNGRGGIREIEFFVQALQLLHAGRFPFLQTGSTVEALDRLHRYELIEAEEKAFLTEAYGFLRTVEHRLQMEGERQTHSLPDKPEARAALAVSLGFDSPEAFEAKLREVRERVRALYGGMFGADEHEGRVQAWSLYLAEGKAGPEVEEQVGRWFGGCKAGEVLDAMRDFVQGGRSRLLTRELVLLFLDLSERFDALLPRLARPARTLARLGTFAGRYGARKAFFKACAGNPPMLDALCLLFDRSVFIHELLCDRPEMLEEIFSAGLRRSKSMADHRAEIARLPAGDEFARWLWLYTKAEQVRLAAADLLGDDPCESLEGVLTTLAEAVLAAALERADPRGHLCVVGLGKLGGREITLGSDLDCLCLVAETSPQAEAAVRALFKLLHYSHPRLGRTFELDLRLRPHGQDGPLATTLHALRVYHAAKGAGQPWERLVLVRARVVAGNMPLGKDFEQWREEMLFARPPGGEDLASVWALRVKSEREKGALQPPERAYKAGAGGLLDTECLAQMLVWAHGGRHPRLRAPSSRAILRAAAAEGVLEKAASEELLQNYDFLRRLELCLRREVNEGVDHLPDDPERLDALSVWLGYPEFSALQADLSKAMVSTRACVEAKLEELHACG